MTRLLTLILSLTGIILLSGCEKKLPLNYRYQLTPYEAYKKSLVLSRLDSKGIGKAWLQAGEQALKDSLTIRLPFDGTAYFTAEKPMAIGYRFWADPGEEITVTINVTSDDEILVFADVFEEVPNGNQFNYKRLFSSDSSLSFSFEVQHRFAHIIRVQPELLVSGHFKINILNQPSLAFPVSGKDSRAVWSVWGDPRDGGKRRHRGIDIFARRGTPALAAFDATVRRVGYNRLGGKIVSLWDQKHQQNIYYAHLDSQLVRVGQKVLKGDTIGFIGNTGNAITTPPHLHFGIYKRGRGAVNPYHFVVPKHQKTADPAKLDIEYLGKWASVIDKTPVYLSNTSRSKTVSEIDTETPVFVMASNGNWIRVQLPNKTKGFIHQDLIDFGPINMVAQHDSTSIIRKEPLITAAPVGVVSKGASLSIMGSYQDFLLIRSGSMIGWLMIQP